jgi:KipI family sensor histidine kinase inhibitor
MSWPRVLDAGEAALVVEFADRIDPAANARVMALDAAVTALALPGVVECVPTYRSLMVHLDPLSADADALRTTLLRLAEAAEPVARPARRWRVPVVYGGAFGMDLDDLAARHGLDPAALVAAHAAADYTVAMIGFMPGFAYLAGLDPALATPRRAEPRPRIPAGSVSIGGAQGAIGSLEAPSGWHLLGRTPMRVFMSERDPVFLFAPGDLIRFAPVPEADWPALDAAATAGEPVAEPLP